MIIICVHDCIIILQLLILVHDCLSMQFMFYRGAHTYSCCWRGSKCRSEISSRGPYFLTKLVPGGGPNFAVLVPGGSYIFIDKLVPGGPNLGGVYFYHDSLHSTA